MKILRKSDMKKKELKEKIIDLVNEDLSREEADEVIAGLSEEETDIAEVESLKKINHLLDETEIKEPSPEMDSKFYGMLDDERDELISLNKSIKTNVLHPAFNLSTALKIAAGIALFILGWFSASWSGQSDHSGNEIAELSREITGIKEALFLTMLDQSSSLDRIKAVNMVRDFENPDERIIGGLLQALNHDTNDNVRLLALETLIRYSANPVVRKGLVESIPYQSSPLVQLRLAEVMIALDEKEAVPEFRKVLMDASLNYNVRTAVNKAVTVLL
jgi:hypothetical protein